jgi:hypothetical protein
LHWALLPTKNAQENAALRQYTPQARSTFWLLQPAFEHAHARLLSRFQWNWTVLLHGDHSLTHGAEPFLRSCQLCSHSRTSQRFMELKGSLPRSQEASTDPYPKPDQSNPYHPILCI